MNKRAEEILRENFKVIISTMDHAQARNAFFKMAELSDALDSMGEEKDADRVDALIKEAQNWWSGLLGGLLGSGGTVLDAFKGGKLLSKEALVEIVKKFIMGAGVAMLSTELVKVLFEHVPFLKWFADSEVIKAIIVAAITYAVTNSTFVDELVEGFFIEFDKMTGMKLAKTPQNKAPVAAPKPTLPATEPAK